MAKWGEIKCPRCAEADDLVQAAVERGFWLGRSCGGSKAEIDAALAAIREGGE
jgi:phage FluMu protein Com